MKSSIFLDFKHVEQTDLNMYQCGREDCEPGHFYGPAVRDHFLIHYISGGKGSFYIDDRVYRLHSGQGFLICPGIVTFYQADHKEPWSYSWVGFNGLKAGVYLKSAGLTRENPVFTYDRDDYIKRCFDEMIAAKDFQKGREIRLLGFLYLFLSQLVETYGKEKFMDQAGDRKEIYARKAIEYIGMNYSLKISIEDIARHIGLDRSYLGSIFKERLDTSLQEFLIGYRVNKACGLLKGGSLSIGDISRSVGYDDPLLFSKVFKKYKGISPRQYRKEDESGAG